MGIQCKQKLIHQAKKLIKELIYIFKQRDWHRYGPRSINLISAKKPGEACTLLKKAVSRSPKKIYLLKLLDYANAYQNPKKPPSFTNIKRSHYQLSARDLITYSCDPKYFPIIQQRRRLNNSFRPRHSDDKKALFVAGMGRSGTTALGQLLNCSKDLELYTELYPEFRQNGYRPEDFDRQTISKKLTKSIHYQQDSIIFERHTSSTTIGDKRPGFQFSFELTQDNFQKQKVRVVYILRNLHDICRSSHLRATNDQDLTWEREKDIEHTVLTYNASCRLFIDLQRRRPELVSQVIFVDYETIFSHSKKIHYLLKSLNLRIGNQEHIEINMFLKKSQSFLKPRARNNSTEAKIQSLINFYLDFKAHEQFIAIAKEYEL